jgi:hypothetical protein
MIGRPIRTLCFSFAETPLVLPVNAAKAIAKYKPSLLPDTKLDALIAKMLR